MKKDGHTERRKLLLSELADQKIGASIISDPKHIFYFTGFSTSKTRLSSFLVTETKAETHHLFVSRSEEPEAKSVFNGNIVSYPDYDLNERMVAYPYYVSVELGKFLDKSLSSKKLGVVGVEDWNLPKIALDVIGGAAMAESMVGISQKILSIRLTKGRDELQSHREAARRLDFAYELAKSLAREGNSEIQMYREINSRIMEAEGAFQYWRHSNVEGDFISGERTLEMVGFPTTRQFRNGETVILDLQKKFDYHWGDTARVFVVGTSVTEEQKRALGALIRAKEEAERLLRPDTVAGDIYKAVSNMITQSGYKPLPHHAGHGIGLDSQEPPFFIPSSDETLEEGMVVAIEPGLYDDKAGGLRIEDNYIILKDGIEKISNFPIAF